MAQHIQTVGDVRRAMRVGPYAWPGGYDTFFFMDDGECLCYPCAVEHRRQIIWSVGLKVNDGWRAVEFDATCNHDGPIYCAHCETPIIAEEPPTPRYTDIRDVPPATTL